MFYEHLTEKQNKFGIRIASVPSHTTEALLKAHFEQAGPLKRVYVRDVGVNDFCFLYFSLP